MRLSLFLLSLLSACVCHRPPIWWRVFLIADNVLSIKYRSPHLSIRPYSTNMLLNILVIITVSMIDKLQLINASEYKGKEDKLLSSSAMVSGRWFQIQTSSIFNPLRYWLVKGKFRINIERNFLNKSFASNLVDIVGTSVVYTVL